MTDIYRQFIEDIHPELLPHLNALHNENNAFKRLVETFRPELRTDFEKYTERLPETGEYRIVRLYVSNPEISKLSFFLDLARDNETGKYLFLAEDGKPANGDMFDNVGILSYKPGRYESSLFGVYVRRGDSFACVFDDKGEALYYYPSNGTRVGWFLKNGLPYFRFSNKRPDERIYQMFAGMKMQWLKDETIILDERTKIIPRLMPVSGHCIPCILAVKDNGGRWHGRRCVYRWPQPDPNLPGKSLDDFMAEWNAADEAAREKLRNGLGYDIGL